MAPKKIKQKFKTKKETRGESLDLDKIAGRLEDKLKSI